MRKMAVSSYVKCCYLPGSWRWPLRSSQHELVSRLSLSAVLQARGPSQSSRSKCSVHSLLRVWWAVYSSQILPIGLSVNGTCSCNIFLSYDGKHWFMKWSINFMLPNIVNDFKISIIVTSHYSCHIEFQNQWGHCFLNCPVYCVSILWWWIPWTC